MRVLVSGSGGFIGRSLVERLEADGHTVHRLVRRPPSPGEAQLDTSAGRIDTSALPGGSLEGLDAVFNLAGEPISPARWLPAKRERIRSSRLTTTDVLARALAATSRPPAVLVSASAIGYYGDRGDELLVEGSRRGTGFLAEVCAGWEQATAPASGRGIRVVHVRTAMVLGAGGGTLATLLPIFRAGLGGRLGSGSQWMSWIAMEDEIGALMHAWSSDQLHGALNATGPEPVRSSELTKELAAAIGRPAVLAVPAPAIRLAVGRRTADELVLASQRVLPEKLRSTGYEFSRPTLRSAIRAAVPGAAHEPGDSSPATGRAHGR